MLLTTALIPLGHPVLTVCCAAILALGPRLPSSRAAPAPSQNRCHKFWALFSVQRRCHRFWAPFWARFPLHGSTAPCWRTLKGGGRRSCSTRVSTWLLSLAGELKADASVSLGRDQEDLKERCVTPASSPLIVRPRPSLLSPGQCRRTCGGRRLSRVHLRTKHARQRRTLVCTNLFSRHGHSRCHPAAERTG